MCHLFHRRPSETDYFILSSNTRVGWGRAPFSLNSLLDPRPLCLLAIATMVAASEALQGIKPPSNHCHLTTVPICGSWLLPVPEAAAGLAQVRSGLQWYLTLTQSSSNELLTAAWPALAAQLKEL